MYLAVLCVLVAGVAAAPDVVPIKLSAPLASMEQAASDLPKIGKYHIPIGVPEAARIASNELAMPHDADEALLERNSSAPGVMIVGGLASYAGEHPFMAGLVISLTSGETSVCGGSLVSATRVLTAAACYWDGYSQAYSMLVVLGSVLLFSGGTRVYAPSLVVHPLYSPGTVHNDLAVLTIPYQPTTSYVKPITMASGSNQYAGTRAEAIGYGRTYDTAPITTAASQRDVFVDVVSTATCQAYYGSHVATASVVCSSGAAGRNPCGGDQGGPLIIYSSSGDDLLLGVFGFGSTAGCSAGDPAGYMRVTYFYNWITAQL